MAYNRNYRYNPSNRSSQRTFKKRSGANVQNAVNRDGVQITILRAWRYNSRMRRLESLIASPVQSSKGYGTSNKGREWVRYCGRITSPNDVGLNVVCTLFYYPDKDHFVDPKNGYVIAPSPKGKGGKGYWVANYRRTK